MYVLRVVPRRALRLMAACVYSMAQNLSDTQHAWSEGRRVKVGAYVQIPWQALTTLEHPYSLLPRACTILHTTHAMHEHMSVLRDS